jgi:hypothetical protein
MTNSGRISIESFDAVPKNDFFYVIPKSRSRTLGKIRQPQAKLNPSYDYISLFGQKDKIYDASNIYPFSTNKT